MLNENFHQMTVKQLKPFATSEIKVLLLEGKNNLIKGLNDTGVSILKGATIFDNSIVAFGSIVTKSFTETNVIIAGIPAKIVKTNINWKK